MKPVLTKSDMYERWRAGEFGNCPRTWTLDEFLAGLRRGAIAKGRRVTMRYKSPGSPFCLYSVDPREVRSFANAFISDGADPSLVFVNEGAEDESKLTIQGEVCRSHRGLELFYSLSKLKMRDALRADPKNAHGLAAKLILDAYLDPSAREWLDYLLDAYEDHVVEFSTWTRPLGHWGWCTVFWEVRKY